MFSKKWIVIGKRMSGSKHRYRNSKSHKMHEKAKKEAHSDRSRSAAQIGVFRIDCRFWCYARWIMDFTETISIGLFISLYFWSLTLLVHLSYVAGVLLRNSPTCAVRNVLRRKVAKYKQQCTMKITTVGIRNRNKS